LQGTMVPLSRCKAHSPGAIQDVTKKQILRCAQDDILKDEGLRDDFHLGDAMSVAVEIDIELHAFSVECVYGGQREEDGLS
jgi:hypothetical protein